MSNANPHQLKRGFTLVEMLIVAPMVILIIGAFISAIVAMTGEVIAIRAQNVMAYDTEDALNQIEQDVNRSGAFLATNDFSLQSPQNSDGSSTMSFKNVGSSNGTMLLLRSFTTDKNPLDISRQLVFTDQPAGSCDANILLQNQPFTQNIAYFIKDNTLWRRTLIQQGSGTPTLCGTPWQLPSCTPGVTRGSYCKVDDQRMLDNVASFTIKYYTDASTNTEDTVASSSSASDSARTTALGNDTTATIAVTTNQTAAGRDISYSGSLQATR